MLDGPLVEVDEEDDVVPEAADAVHGGHGDDEGKQVVNEGVLRKKQVNKQANTARQRDQTQPRW